MASISSLSSGSSIYGNRGNHIISGLASGLDTEALIEGMVQNLKIKMDNKNKEKTLLGWQQTAIRGISSQLIQLSTKYMSFGSSTNLKSASFFDTGIFQAMGKYSDKISVSGSTSSDIEILGIKNLAKNSSAAFDKIGNFTGDKNQITGNKEFNLSDEKEVSNLAGKSLSFKYNNKSYNVILPADGDYSDMEKAASEIQKAINNAISGTDEDGNPNEEIVKIGISGGKFDISYGNDAENSADFEFTGGSSLEALGIEEGNKFTGQESFQTKDVSLTSRKKYWEILSNSSLEVEFNGKKGVLNFPELNEGSTEQDIIDSLNKQLESQFGAGRVTVENGSSNGKFSLSFKVTNGDSGNSFKISSGSAGLLGEDGILGIGYGDTNGINTNATLKELGIDVGDGFFEINGTRVNSTAYDENTTLSQILSDINSSSAGVKVSYSQTSGQFVFTATQGGSGGRVEISGGLAERMFGKVNTSTGEGSNIVKGEDAHMAVRINGMEMVISSDTNSFNIDGLAVTAEDTFNVENFKDDVDGKFKFEGADSVEKIKFKKNQDTDKIVDAVKSFVEDYNKMLKDLGDAYSTYPDKKYQPLTDAQKADMTESQIKEYEEKAKQGILFGDGDLRNLSSEIRMIFSTQAMRDIGITTSNVPSDKGKLIIDENKLRAAIESDPDKVAKAFAGGETKDEDGNVVNEAGAMEKLSKVFDKYAKTSGSPKGILIERAGSESSALSLINNSIQKQMNEIDKEIDRITEQLEDKIDFYTVKFSKLEMLVSQMNSQSSYLAGMSGGM